MKRECIWAIITATATLLDDEPALRLVSGDFVNGFTTYLKFERKSTELAEIKEETPILDQLFTYMQNVGITPPIESRGVVVERFLTVNVYDMLTSLVSRPIIRKSIVDNLYGFNRHVSVYGRLKSNRVDAVVDDFIRYYQRSCAHSYIFDGGLLNHVIHSFRNFYYEPHKRDIWRKISEADTASLRMEKGVVGCADASIEDQSDLLIHDIMIHIVEANEILFRHSGHSEDTKGIQSDLFYAILCILCEEKVSAINLKLDDSEQAIGFVDFKDRKKTYTDPEGNTYYVANDIAAKIDNAKILVAEIFEELRRGTVNFGSLQSLRSKCFGIKLKNHGHKTIGGRSSIWDIKDGSVTVASYINEPESKKNFKNFDKILHGVCSVYTLMVALESRGVDLVNWYKTKYFVGNTLTPFIDYLSSLPYLDKMREMQEAGKHDTNRTDKLYTFDEMVYHYAGSDQNNETHIRENRFHARIHGFLKEPKLKQSTLPRTLMDGLGAVMRAMDMIPKGRQDYATYLGSGVNVEFGATMRTNLTAKEQYSLLESNIFLIRDPVTAESYTNYTLHDGLRPMTFCVDSTYLKQALLVGMSDATASPAVESAYIYVPLEDMFCSYYKGSLSEFESITLADAQLRDDNIARQCGRRVFTFAQYSGDSVVQDGSRMTELAGTTYTLMTDMGVHVPHLSDAMAVVEKTQILPKYRVFLNTYYTWFFLTNSLQQSLTDLMQVIFAEVLFLTSDVEAVASYPKEDVERSHRLLTALSTYEFSEDDLNWILAKIWDAGMLTYPVWDVNGISEYKDVDRGLLDYCFTDKQLDSPYLEFTDIAEWSTLSPAQRFVYLANGISVVNEWLRFIRDSYSLLIRDVTKVSKSLICELNQKFKVIDTLEKFRHVQSEKLLTLESLEPRDLLRYDKYVRDTCFAKFESGVNALSELVREAEDGLTNIIPYAVSDHDTGVVEKLKQYGLTLSYSALYSSLEFPTLGKLRSICSTDDYGFFTYNGVYFNCVTEDAVYYVHKRGGMVELNSDGTESIIFNTPIKDRDSKSLYEYLLDGGLQSLGCKDC